MTNNEITFFNQKFKIVSATYADGAHFWSVFVLTKNGVEKTYMYDDMRSLGYCMPIAGFPNSNKTYYMDCIKIHDTIL